QGRWRPHGPDQRLAAGLHDEGPGECEVAVGGPDDGRGAGLDRRLDLRVRGDGLLRRAGEGDRGEGPPSLRARHRATRRTRPLAEDPAGDAAPGAPRYPADI